MLSLPFLPKMLLLVTGPFTMRLFSQQRARLRHCYGTRVYGWALLSLMSRWTSHLYQKKREGAIKDRKGLFCCQTACLLYGDFGSILGLLWV